MALAPDNNFRDATMWRIHFHVPVDAESMGPLNTTRTELKLALAAVAELVRQRAPALKLTVDPVESRGYEYHTGVTFTFFALAARSELGRGGRYLASSDEGTPGTAEKIGGLNGGGGESEGEPATGVTLFLDAVIRALPAAAITPRVYLPAGTSPDEAERLRKIVKEAQEQSQLQQEAYIKMESELDEKESVLVCERVQTKEFVDGPTVAFLGAGKLSVPATGLDLVFLVKRK